MRIDMLAGHGNRMQSLSADTVVDATNPLLMPV
jgi:hypothetical protein